MNVKTIAAKAVNYVADNKAKSAAIFFLGITAVAAAILLPMTFTGKFSPGMKNWMSHNLRIAGTNMGDRWMYIAGAGAFTTLVGGAGLAILLFKKPAKPESPSTSDAATNPDADGWYTFDREGSDKYWHQDEGYSPYKFRR